MPAHAFTDRASWLKFRQGTIGASESSAALNANPYQSALSLYARKRAALDGDADGAAGDEETRKMRAGRILERGIAEFWAAEKGVELIEPIELALPVLKGGVSSTPGSELAGVVFDMPPGQCLAPLSATPDYFAHAEGEPLPYLVEIKNVTPELRMDSDGKVLERVPAPSWKQGPPLIYAIQVMQQMAVLRANGIEVAAAFLVGFMGGDEFVEYEIPWDDELWALSREKLERFWTENVLRSNPPMIDEHTTSDQVYAAYRKATSGKSVEIDVGLVVAFRDAKEQAKIAEDAADQAKAALQAAMGDAEVATVNGGVVVVNWKNQTQERPATPARTINMRVLRLNKQAATL